MIIFGTRMRYKTLGEGQFYCPKCQQTRAYVHKQASRYFALYFVPLVPMGSLGEFVECQTCHTTFKPDVLQQGSVLRAAAAANKIRASLASQINALPDRLSSGTPVEYVLRDLTAAGLDRTRAQEMIALHLNGERRRCEACGLTYAGTVTACAECHGPLS
jgi:hypothetical protein